MNASLEALKTGLLIDKNDLDSALIQQPDLYHQVSEQYAKALSRRDQTKRKMEEEEAAISMQTRQKAMDEGLKITEAAVANVTKLDEMYIKIQVAYLKLKEETDLWKALLDSFEQRSYALTELVNLYVGGYWSPDFPKTTRQDKATEEIRNLLAEGRRARQRE